MDPNVWLKKWHTNEIDFHEIKPNPLLVKHFKELAMPKDSRIFLPLCGKTRDFSWLLAHGYRVGGAELCHMAVRQLFADLRVRSKTAGAGRLTQYSAKNIEIFAGNIFDMTDDMLGTVDAVYDREALVALPGDMRQRYTTQLKKITGKAPQLLITYEFDENLMKGPPFSVGKEELERHYADSYTLRLLESKEMPGGLHGTPARENVWVLKKN